MKNYDLITGLVLLDEQRSGGQLHVTGMRTDGKNDPWSRLGEANSGNNGPQNAKESFAESHHVKLRLNRIKTR